MDGAQVFLIVWQLFICLKNHSHYLNLFEAAIVFINHLDVCTCYFLNAEHSDRRSKLLPRMIGSTEFCTEIQQIIEHQCERSVG